MSVFDIHGLAFYDTEVRLTELIFTFVGDWREMQVVFGIMFSLVLFLTI